jgi:hypothetical protein
VHETQWELQPSGTKPPHNLPGFSPVSEMGGIRLSSTGLCESRQRLDHRSLRHGQRDVLKVVILIHLHCPQ